MQVPMAAVRRRGPANLALFLFLLYPPSAPFDRRLAPPRNAVSPPSSRPVLAPGAPKVGFSNKSRYFEYLLPQVLDLLSQKQVLPIRH